MHGSSNTGLGISLCIKVEKEAESNACAPRNVLIYTCKRLDGTYAICDLSFHFLINILWKFNLFSHYYYGKQPNEKRTYNSRISTYAAENSAYGYRKISYASVKRKRRGPACSHRKNHESEMPWMIRISLSRIWQDEMDEGGSWLMKTGYAGSIRKISMGVIFFCHSNH